MLQECSSLLTPTKAFQPSPGPVVSKKQPNIHCSDTLSFGFTELIDRKCFSVWGSLISTYWSCFVFLSNLCVISSHLSFRFLKLTFVPSSCSLPYCKQQDHDSIFPLSDMFSRRLFFSFLPHNISTNHCCVFHLPCAVSHCIYKDN